jgi:HSP20 family protein
MPKNTAFAVSSAARQADLGAPLGGTSAPAMGFGDSSPGSAHRLDRTGIRAAWLAHTHPSGGSTIWDPFADLSRIQRRLETKYFATRGAAAGFAPAVDIHEDAEALVLRAELPGVKREDIEIDVEANVLTVKGERKLEAEPQDRRYHRVERPHGAFARQFQLPNNVDASQIDAQLADGVLTVKLPKKQEQKSRKIEVKSGGTGNTNGN